MTLGNITYQNFAACQLELKTYDILKIDDILGGNLTSKSTWGFDLENETITTSNELNTELVKDFKKIKTKLLVTGTPTISVNYFGAIKENNVYFDTGFDGLFYINKDVFEKLLGKGLVTKKAEGNGLIATTAFGTEEGTTYAIGLEMNLGKNVLQPFISDVSLGDSESNMGSEWLAYYHTIISGNKLYFKKNKVDLEQKFVSKGIKGFIDEKGLYMSFIWNNSEAQQKGIKVGYRILSLNNQTVNPENKQQQENLIEEFVNSEQSVSLEINKKGNVIQLNNEIILDISSL